MKVFILLSFIFLSLLFSVFLYLSVRSIGFLEDKLEMAQHDLDVQLDVLRHDLNLCELHIKSILKDMERTDENYE